MDIVRSILTTFYQPHWPESLCWESRGAESRIYVVWPTTFRSLSPMPIAPCNITLLW